MRMLVTGVAGFIGSHLAASALQAGHDVIGVDCFTPFYGRNMKVANIDALGHHDRFCFVDLDLRLSDVRPLVSDADVVCHLAGQPGVRTSWGTNFSAYAEHNVVVTQRLLEAARDRRVRRFIHFSSSSVYGHPKATPWHENDVPVPASPYGVTKLASEHLCRLYAEQFGIPTVSLRPFSVYGPKQRPDMAVHRLINAGLTGGPFAVLGDGSQTRSFTYVGDVVAAAMAATSECVRSGSTINIGRNSPTSIADLIGVVEHVLETRIRVTYRDAGPGDATEIVGSFAKAAQLLGWEGTTPLHEGIEAQARWQRIHTTRSAVEGSTTSARGLVRPGRGSHIPGFRREL